MKRIVLVFFLLLMIRKGSTQCECYEVVDLYFPKDTPNILKVGFKNSCDYQAYLQGWIFNDKNDTLARYTDCFCGIVLPFNKTIYWDFKTELEKLPNLDQLRIGIGYFEPTFCPEVKFKSTVNINLLNKARTVIYPNPTNQIINIETNAKINELRLFNINKKLIEQKTNLNDSNYSLTLPDEGIYILELRLDDNSIYIEKILRNYE